MTLFSSIPAAAAHMAAFVSASAVFASAWDSPHAICLAAAVTLFGGKFLRDHAGREDRSALASRSGGASAGELAPVLG